MLGSIDGFGEEVSVTGETSVSAAICAGDCGDANPPAMAVTPTAMPVIRSNIIPQYMASHQKDFFTCLISFISPSTGRNVFSSRT
mmetsp:Transcript_6578/g.8581  ORF Transcript_6578/g.8581 Transcript_6578/m.8581 type:complete len:85 (-) Transcript_6578:731-985(-)